MLMPPKEGAGMEMAPRADGSLEIDGRRYLAKRPLDRLAKRAFDIAVSALGLVVALPLFAAIAVLIRLDSRGPVFYRQKRVGRHRQPFLIWKFRKMYEDLPTQGPSLTRRYDFRMTRVGRILERTKLDELPQLINVLWGEMSVIGPRPEVPKFVEHYAERWQDVLSVKPGIFGPNQLKNRNESELYPAGCEDVEGFYVRHILPDKLDIDADYARHSGALSDVVLLVRCLLVSTMCAVTWRTVVTRRIEFLNLGFLAIAGIAGMAGAHLLAGLPLTSAVAWHALLLAAVFKPVCLVALRVPKSLALSMTADDFVRLVWCSLGSTALIVLGMMGLNHRDLDGLALGLDSGLFLSVLLVHKLLLHTGYVTFSVQKGRALARRLVRVSLLAAPFSMIVAITLRHGPEAWLKSGPLCFSLLLAATVVRPTLLVLMRPPGQRPKALDWMLSEWPRLALATALGSCTIVLMTLLMGQPMIEPADLLLDAGLFVALMTGYALVQNRAIVQAGTASPENGPRPIAGRQRLLVAGSGLELNAFVNALAGLPESDYQILGIVTPHGRDRSSTIGKYTVVGEFVDVPEILKTMNVDKLVVLPDGIRGSSLALVQEAAAERRCPCVTVSFLSGLRAGECVGVPSPLPARTSVNPAP